MLPVRLDKQVVRQLVREIAPVAALPELTVGSTRKRWDVEGKKV